MVRCPARLTLRAHSDVQISLTVLTAIWIFCMATLAVSSSHDLRSTASLDVAAMTAAAAARTPNVLMDLSATDAPWNTTEILKEFYYALNGSSWVDDRGWLVEANFCNWTGIVCFDGEVIAIKLVENNLLGTLPTSLGLIKSLNFLILYANNIYGTIPTELGLLPNLQSIILVVNHLTGPIPSELGMARQLNSLVLGFNRLTGTIPSELSQLTNISTIILEGNSLSGSIPSEIGHLSQLTELIIGSNELNGTIPSELGNCSMLSILSLSWNELEGSIPEDLFRLRNLSSLNLSNNKVSGTISNGFLNLKVIASINLAVNALSGTIPEVMTEMRSLSELDLGHNQLTGTVPSLHVSRRLMLSANRFVGTLREMLMIAGAAGTLLLDFSSNPFINGSFPYEKFEIGELALVNLNEMLLLDVSNCNISGSLPDIIFETLFGGMKMMNLAYNPYLVGNLPMHYLSTSQLMYLDVTDTGLRNENNDLTFIAKSAFPHGNGTYVCEIAQFNRPVLHVQGLSPAYYNYEHCKCFSDYRGSPPNCFPKGASTALGIGLSVSLGLVLFAIASYFGFRFYRTRRLISVKDKALAQYPGLDMHRSQSTVLTSPLLYDSQPTGSASEPLQVLVDKHLLIPHKSIEILKVVAHGASGIIQLGIWQHSNVAVKQFYPGVNLDYRDFAAETKVHSQLRHPNVVLLLGICVDPLCTVMEFMSRGSLFHVIREQYDALIGRRRRVALDVARGMNYLHSRGILHRDLKSLNVLMDEHWTAKVADFGSARVQEHHMTINRGTPAWMGPEVFDTGHYSTKSDVFSFGIVLWEIVSGQMPYVDSRFTLDVRERVRRGERPPMPDDVPLPERTLIERSWDADPLVRPEFTEIVEILERNLQKSREENNEY